jgi:hypothetical protein
MAHGGGGFSGRHKIEENRQRFWMRFCSILMISSRFCKGLESCRIVVGGAIRRRKAGVRVRECQG